MRVLFRHLEKFTNKKLNFDNTITDLENLGIEVENSFFYDYDRVEVVKILNIKNHPNADKLQIASVTNGNQEFEIICGATNIQINHIVPLARIGARLGNLKIDKAKIRGINSEGMLCSSKELGINFSSDGILLLDSTFKIGDNLSKYYSNPSYLDLNITPNRPDWLSAYGIARELKAKYKLNIEKSDEVTNSENNSKSLYYAYYLVKISKINNLNTPQEIVQDLITLGTNPKNNILIDLTNWMTSVYGQPLHAFDSFNIKGNIQVRKAKKNEFIKLIDETELQLNTEDIIISDSMKPIALAGIMGGLETSVNNQTNEIFLESASFIPDMIRRSSVKHKLTTDASIRFEKGVDPNLSNIVIKEAVSILKSINPKLKIEILTEKVNFKQQMLKFDFLNIKKILGVKVSKDRANLIFKHLGYIITDDLVKIPSWRFDISFQEDLVEDILRFIDIKEITHKYLLKTDAKINKNNSFIKKLSIKSELIKHGFIEVQNLSFVSATEITNINLTPKNYLKVLNPISSETEYMRPSLLIGLLKSIKQNPVFKSHLIFEIGNVFNKNISTQEAIGLIATKDKLIELNNFITDIKKTPIITIDHNILNKFKIKLNQVFYIELPLGVFKNYNEIELNTNKNKKFIDFTPLPPSIKDVSIWIENTTDVKELINKINIIDQSLLIVEIFDKYYDSKIKKTAIGLRILIQPQQKSFTSVEIDGIFNKVISFLEKNNYKIR